MQYTTDKKLEKVAVRVRKIYAWVGFIVLLAVIPTAVYIIINIIK